MRKKIEKRQDKVVKEKQNKAAKRIYKRHRLSPNKLTFCWLRWGELKRVPPRVSPDDFYLSIQLTGNFTLSDQQRKKIEDLFKVKLQRTKKTVDLHCKDRRGSKAKIGGILKKLLNILYEENKP